MQVIVGGLVSQSTKGDSGAEHSGLKVTAKESLREPPLLVAANEETSRIVWDLNPQLKKL